MPVRKCITVMGEIRERRRHARVLGNDSAYEVTKQINAQKLAIFNH